MPPPFAEPTNISDVLGIVQYSNTVTDNYAGLLFVMVIIIVLFALALTKGYRLSQCSIFAFSLGFILSALLWAMGLILSQVLIIVLALALASVLWDLFDK